MRIARDRALNLDRVTLCTIDQSKGDVGYLEMAARQSRTCARLWLRYLNKVINHAGRSLSPEDAEELMSGEVLTAFQKVVLSRAVEEGSPTNFYVRGLDGPARLTAAAKLKELVSGGRIDA